MTRPGAANRHCYVAVAAVGGAGTWFPSSRNPPSARLQMTLSLFGTKQFDDEDNIRPWAVQQAIMQTTHADLLFKVNIFGLQCNTLCQSMSMGTCDLSMLSKVTKDLDLSHIDWCGYVFDYLKDTRSAWNPYSKKGLYVGPIIFLLLLYVESVRCDSVKIVRGRPAICFWNVDKLRERERVECRTIGLGMGEMQEPFQVINESAATGNIVHDTVQTNEAGEGVKLSDGSFTGNEGKEDFNGCGDTVEDYADFVNGSTRKYFHSTPSSKMEMPIPLSVVPFINEHKGLNRRGDRPRMKSDYLQSPYIMWAVDITKRIPRPEKHVADWIFSLGEPM
ncbi:unnamed protein product [Lactuca virosa]|uniref:Uncharacterized protein n=1 Tax=Lactuca virosa TaxID=75947 RepID=A0AAU9MB79_9ASTR|nr:unnamed protein product [Lactuca virosa]